MSDLQTSYDTLTKAVGAIWLRRDVIKACGPETESYLQGQLSQDVATIAPGTTAWSFVLQPHGKVDALVRLTRTAADAFLIDTDGGHGDALLERLGRFKLRTKVEFTKLDWKVLALRGPDSGGAAKACAPPGAILSDATWPGMQGVDILAAAVDIPAGVPLCDYEAYEAVRIEAGIPEMGSELDERTIPAEAGINNRTISFTKGCYTGQELVARIDSRGGNVPRNLRGLVLEGSALPDLGARINPTTRLTPTTKPYGYISSVAFSPRLGAPVALGMIRRDVQLPIAAVVSWDDGTTPAQILELPLTSFTP